MFTAFGIGAHKNKDGSITVKVRIVEDSTQSVLAIREFTDLTIMKVRALILLDLQARKDAVTDVTLNAAVVGQVLGTV